MSTENEAKVVQLLQDILATLERSAAPPSALMGADELARQLGVNVRTLRRMRHEGSVPEPIRIGRLLRWKRIDVDRYLQSRRP
jgi:excisionase family DNA binding protein